MDCRKSQVLAEQAVEVVGSVPDPRVLVRTAIQRLMGVGGWETIKDSYVNISSTPTGASVFVDDLLEGVAPLRVPVAPGRHSIKATLPGYADWSMDLKVKTWETLSLNAAPVTSTIQPKTDGGRIITGFAVPYAATFDEGALYLVGVQSARPYVGLLLVAPPLTYILMSNKVSRSEISLGQAYMIMSSGLWGAAWGLMGAGASNFDEPRPYVAAAMAASAAGISFSSRFATQQELSRKRVSLINGGGFLGSAIGLGIPYLFNADKGYALGLLTGGIIGTVSAIKLTRGLDFVGTKDSMASFIIDTWFGMAPTDSGARGSEKHTVNFGGSLLLAF